MSVVRTPGFCALCKSRCGSVMVTENGRLVAQESNPQHPTGAALCVKGKAAPEIVYRPERQLYPMMRTRPKGDPDPGWKRISWDEALDRTAEALSRVRDEHGAEAVAFSWTTPSGTPISDDIRWVERFTNAFGSPNIAYGVEVCNWHKDHAHAYTLGRSVASPDFQNAGCVVLWGHNPSATWLDHATATAAAGKRGAKIVVVDPRKAGFAQRADQWLRVRPGSDGALALGIAGEMIRNGWFDEAFMTDWSNGPLLVRTDTMRFLRASEVQAHVVGDVAGEDMLVAIDRESGDLIGYERKAKRYGDGRRPYLRRMRSVPLRTGEQVACKTAFELYSELCDQHTPEVVEATCWVPKAQVTETARLLHEAGPVCYYLWTGTGQHTNATQTDRAIAILMSLTGSFDAPGGNVDFSKPPSNDVTGADLLTPAQRAKCIELGRSALGPGRNAWITSESLYTAILEERPYAVRAMFGFGRNFLVTHGNSTRGTQAFAKLEFYVHTDVVMTPTASYADIFLPINTPWERESLRVGFEGSQAAESRVQFRQAAIESRGESRSDGFVVFELAKRLGMGHMFWNGDIEAGMNHVLAPTGLTVEQLREQPSGIDFALKTRYRKYLESGFKTWTGKVEVFSEVFRDAGQDPLPVFVEPAMSPMRQPASTEFPLVLTSAKVVHFCHSQHRDIASLRKRSPEPELQMHPHAAAQRGIDDGAMVELRTHLGSVRMRARLDAALDARVVWSQYGWWAGNQTLELPGWDAFGNEGANVNRLISDKASDPISGSVAHRSYLCDVVPVTTATPGGWTGWRAFRIERRHAEANGIVSFTMSPVDGAALPSFHGGQHVNVRVRRADGTQIVRCYSLSGRDNGGSFRISVKLAQGAEGRTGEMSGFLHALAEHDGLELQAPKGSFHLPPAAPGARFAAHEGPLVMVAAGIGITPMLSMLHQLQNSGRRAPVRLLYGVRSGSDHAFRDEIDALCRAFEALSVTTFYSEVDEADRTSMCFDREGRITAEAVLEAHGTAAEFYLCGPPSMVEHVTGALDGAGVPGARVHLEAFGPSSRKKALVHRGPQTVRLARSLKTITWTPDAGSLLDQLERAGAALGSGCRTGQCESCMLRLVSGDVLHPQGSAAVESGHCLPCVAVPLSPVSLDA